MTALDTIAAYDSRIWEHRATLARLLAERKDPMDLPRTMTQREVNDYSTATSMLRQQIADFESVVSQWAVLPPPTDDTVWLAHLHSWRQTLSDELLTIKSPIRGKDAKERSDRLAWSIRFVDFGWSIAPPNLPIVDVSHMPIGKLMDDAGFSTVGEALRGPHGWQGSIREIKQRTKELTKQRAAIQKALDRLMVTPDESAQAEAESQTFAAAMRTMDIKNNARGNGLVALTLDGDPLSVDDMTSEQRSAFERFVHSVFPPREPESAESETGGSEPVTSESETVKS
jgi:hypothetical protein